MKCAVWQKQFESETRSVPQKPEINANRYAIKIVKRLKRIPTNEYEFVKRHAAASLSVSRVTWNRRVNGYSQQFHELGMGILHSQDPGEEPWGGMMRFCTSWTLRSQSYCFTNTHAYENKPTRNCSEDSMVSYFNIKQTRFLVVDWSGVSAIIKI